MVAQHYRWDFIGLSTDVKPTPATSEKVVDGSTFYCSDTSKLYVWCDSEWYEKTATGGGGGTTYTAGDGIDITNNEISVDTDTIQEKLTAGTGIDITDNTISATGGGGGEPDYSTSEVETGTKWIDGKMIYKKSYSVTITVNSGSLGFNLLINNLYEIVKVDGFFHPGGTLSAGGSLNFPGGSFDQNISLTFYSGQCSIISNSRKDTVLKITVYYTKSV